MEPEKPRAHAGLLLWPLASAGRPSVQVPTFHEIVPIANRRNSYGQIANYDYCFSIWYVCFCAASSHSTCCHSPKRFPDRSSKSELPDMVRTMGDKVGHEGQRHYNKDKALQILGVVLHGQR
jgi:hypothetical protein